jgi:hypothetical protein
VDAKLEFNEIFVDPKLSLKDKEKVRKEMLKFASGVAQSWIGDKGKEISDQFYSFLDPTVILELNVSLHKLHDMLDFERFRIQMGLLLFDAFSNGFLLGKNDEEEKPATTETNADVIEHVQKIAKEKLGTHLTNTEAGQAIADMFKGSQSISLNDLPPDPELEKMLDELLDSPNTKLMHKEIPEQ